MKAAAMGGRRRVAGRPRWAADLVRAVGAERASWEQGELEAHAGDAWFARRTPEAVVFADSAETVSRLLRFASARGIPVTPRGAGRGYVGGCVPSRGGVALSLARMNRIREIHAADGVAVVEPGVITGDLQDAALRRGLFYPPDPASLRETTIGGNIATNAGGPRCLKYGVTRHYVLGVEAVLADGSVARLGGRTHKNKTGFDLAGLLVGSEGMLGVVTLATLRLLPRPAGRAVVSAGFARSEQAAACVQAILASGLLPAAMEVADKFTLEAARRHLGARVAPAGNAHLLVEVDGGPAAVRADAAAVRRVAERCGALRVAVARTERGCEALWQLRRQFSQSLKATGLTKLNEDVTVPRGRLVDLFRLGAELRRRFGLEVACFGHAGDGNIHVNVMADMAKAGVPAKVEAALDALFDRVIAWGGAITGEHGVGLAKKRWWPRAVPAETRAMHAAIKRAVDPRGILNPGKFLG